MQTANRRAEPLNAIWKDNWLNGKVLLAKVQLARGEIDLARRNLDDAASVAASLAASDRKNLPWQQFDGICQSLRARLLLATDPVQRRNPGDQRRCPASCGTCGATGRRAIPEIVRRQPAVPLLSRIDETVAGGIAAACAEARATVAPAWAKKQNDDLRLALAEARLREGDAADAMLDHEAAVTAWTAAERLLRDGLGEPPAFNRLDLLVRVLQALHRDAEASAYLARLDKSGYVPLPTWTASTPALAAAR